MKLLHELWEEDDGLTSFCLAGPAGDAQRGLMRPGAQMIWTVEADSYFEAMTAYYAFMGWGEYTTEHEWDRLPYPEDYGRST